MAGSGNAALRDGARPLLRVDRLSRTYKGRGGATVQAVSDLSFDVLPGETLGVVGESGCGKSTLARSQLMLPPPSDGEVRFEGRALHGLAGEALRAVRPRLQMVFQDPVSSLNPRQRVTEIVEAPLAVHRVGTPEERRARVRQVLLAVGLDPDLVGERRPHELSGGQCQRVSIARALVLQPSLLVCDEPVSSLDVSVQAQVINLLEEAKRQFALTMVFISHDLAVVKSISDRVMVMYLGKVCEVGAVDAVFAAPRHPYTALLLAAIPEADPARARAARPQVRGETPSPMDMPKGCRFHTRCPNASERCRREEPVLRGESPQHVFACHHPVG